MPLSAAKKLVLTGVPRFNGNPYSDYTLLDLFNTPLAAGSVNGTLAEPVGGARTVTDTNSKISVTGGVLDFATGAAAHDGASWAIRTRLLGRTFIGTVTPANNSGQVSFSWSSGVTSFVTNGIQLQSSGNIRIIADTGTLVPVVGTYSAATQYKLAVVMRAAGNFFFVKGGAFTFWTLLYATLLDTDSEYPRITVGNSTVSVFTVDNADVSNRKFIPVPLQSDGFSGATTDGAGNAENNGSVGNAWTGATWAVAAGAVTNTPTLGNDVVVNGGFAADADWTKGAGWAIAGGVAAAVTASSDLTAAVAPLTLGAWYQIVYDLSSFGAGTVAAVIGANVNPTHAANATYTETNRATSTALAMRGVGFTGSIDNVAVKPLTLSQLIRSISASSANVLADVSITRTAGTQSGIIVNLDSAGTPANFVLAYLDGNGNANLDKCVAGVYTNVISAAVTYSAGAVLRVIKDGTSYRLFYNNLAVGSVSTISDAGIISNTLHGLFSTYSANSFDNFVIMARGNENQYAQLDQM